MLAIGMIVNQLNQIFCDLTGYMIYISGYKHTLYFCQISSSRYENVKRYFSLVFFRPNFGCKVGRIKFLIIFRQTQAHCKLKSSERSNWLKRSNKLVNVGLKVALHQK